MLVNIKPYTGESLIYEANPYDDGAGTLKGPKFPRFSVLSPNEGYVDELAYEAHLDILGANRCKPARPNLA